MANKLSKQKLKALAALDKNISKIRKREEWLAWAKSDPLKALPGRTHEETYDDLYNEHLQLREKILAS